jgi:isopentenyl-diphosphate delta-isomerase
MDAPYDPGVKLRHIEACLTQPVEYRKATGFEDYEFDNEALPELSLATLDLSAAIAGRALRWRGPRREAGRGGGLRQLHRSGRAMGGRCRDVGGGGYAPLEK